MVEIGREAPGFTLKDQSGQQGTVTATFASANLATPHAEAEYEEALAKL